MNQLFIIELYFIILVHTSLTLVNTSYSFTVFVEQEGRIRSWFDYITLLLNLCLRFAPKENALQFIGLIFR